MPKFSISRQTALTEGDLLTAFVGAVEKPEHPPRESDGIEGTVESGVMRWRERTYNPDPEGGGVSFGPQCEARATKADGMLTILCTITPSVLFWLVPIAAAVAFLVLCATVAFISPDDWNGPRWVAWLLPVGAALFLAMPFRQLRRARRSACAFLEALLNAGGDHRRGSKS